MAEPVTRTSRNDEDLQQRFFARGDGCALVKLRSERVDQVIARVFSRRFPGSDATGIAAVAVGGYGRSHLFPHSDVDLLLLTGTARETGGQEDRIAGLLVDLWDAKLRVSQSVRTPAECARFHSDNAELSISLLDKRFVAGDEELYGKLCDEALPRFFPREQGALLRNLVELAQSRHARYASTIYHLEPDVKGSPGGLRDFQLACWIAQLRNADDLHTPASEDYLPKSTREAWLGAKRFLFTLRCHLHFFHGRDSNKLSFDAQDSIAEPDSGAAFRDVRSAEDWMREYFRHVRVLSRLASRMIDEAAATRRSLFTQIRDRRSRLSNSDFSVARGRVFLRAAHALETRPALVWNLFLFLARHNLRLAVATEKRIAKALPLIEKQARSGERIWPVLAETLKRRHAYRALSAMRETGALLALFPEYEKVDCLVIRDFYHRYTVDEHMFRAIGVLHRLEDDEDEFSQRFSRLLPEISNPEYIYFALLFHDAGKGVPGGDHSANSLVMADQAMERIGMEPAGRDAVRFLIRHHLTMSNFMRTRNLSEPGTRQELAEWTGTTGRLKALTLVTLADISAVHPSAMTPWRKELLWQLYVATYNELTRQAGEVRIEAGQMDRCLTHAGSDQERGELAQFLEGFPRRYLRTQSPEQVYAHFQLSQRRNGKGSAVSIRTLQRGLREVVVVSPDRPHLFASLCGAISARGLNIEKAEAFSNRRGWALDSFVAADPDQRLEAGVDETRQMEKALERVADGRSGAAELPRARQPLFGSQQRRRIKPSVDIDNELSKRATIFHVTAQDRRGLLYDLAETFSRNRCDIQVVLIDTQGQKAMDVFYVAGADGKLDAATAERIRGEILNICSQA